jgi:hypothetical protein
MLANEARRPYSHPYQIRAEAVSPLQSPLQPAGQPVGPVMSPPRPRTSDDNDQTPAPHRPAASRATTETPADEAPELTAWTVHRLRHIRQVSDQAISVIDQALDRVL